MDLSNRGELLTDEQSKWDVIRTKAETAFTTVHDWLDLRDGSGNALDAACKKKFVCIIRAVSWVESKHGTFVGSTHGDQDPMQAGHPSDTWWKSLTGQAGDGDRFVRGPSFTGPIGAYWAKDLAGVIDPTLPANTKISTLGILASQRQGHDNAKFTQEMSYFWGALYLVHKINTSISGGKSYKCSECTRRRLVAGAVAYNGGGDTAYETKIKDALTLSGCLPES